MLTFDIMQKCYQRLDPFKCGLKVDPDRTIFEIVYMKVYMISLSFTFSLFSSILTKHFVGLFVPFQRQMKA